MRILTSFLFLIMLSLIGCWAPVYVDRLDVQPPQLMVAHKVQIPLFIILDPDKVPDEVQVQTTRGDQMTVHNLHSFVDDHLRVAMQDYFAAVHVISPNDPLPADSHIIAHVQVSRLDMTLMGNQAFGQITWSFALMPSGYDEFIYSFAGLSQGDYGLSHVSQSERMYASTFAAAIADMLGSYTEKEIHQKLRQAEQEAEDRRVNTDAIDI